MPGVPKPPSRETIALADQLALRIARGHFLDYMPGERRLADRLGVPLRRVRNALDLLAGRGLVDRIPGRGTRLRPDAVPATPETLFDRIVVLVPNTQARTVFSQRILGRLRLWASRIHAVSEPSRGWTDPEDDPLAGMPDRDLLRSAFVFMEMPPPASRRRLRERDRPVVFIEIVRPQDLPQACAALLDHRAGVALAVDHLAGLGHRRIALAGRFQESWVLQERLAGFRDAMKRHGLAERTDLHVQYVDLPEERYDLLAPLRSVLARSDRPTALVATGGATGLDILKICAHDRIAVPEALSVVSVCSPVPEVLRNEALALVDLGRPEDLADIAAGLLMRPEPDARPLALRPLPRLSVRHSTTPPPR